MRAQTLLKIRLKLRGRPAFKRLKVHLALKRIASRPFFYKDRFR